VLAGCGILRHSTMRPHLMSNLPASFRRKIALVHFEVQGKMLLSDTLVIKHATWFEAGFS